MSRVPIRLRLTLAFALAMAVVLAAVGGFLYFRLGSSLTEAIDENLDARAAELAPGVAAGGSDLREQGDPDERFFQVLGPDGSVVAGTVPSEDEAELLDSDALARVVDRGTRTFEVADAPGSVGPARVLAKSVETPDGTRVLLVGATLEDRDEALHGFLIELLLVGPAALILASVLGYGLATAALRPVEAMRSEAAAISGAEAGRRLPVPGSRDEISRLGETLNEMLGRLEAALARERQFVADAGHELRTPLALLKAELELALRRPRSREELEDAVRSAAVEAERLARLAEDLLLLARSDQGRLALRLERLDAGELLGRVARRFAPTADASGRSIETSAPDDLVLTADSARLEQALDNLVENALNHGHGRVRLSAFERNGTVELHVLDDGGGFSPAFLPRAFERFSTADDARTGEGTGLGLPIAAAIAATHGGTAHAANRSEGGGADVWLTIPAGDGTEQEPPPVD